MRAELSAAAETFFRQWNNWRRREDVEGMRAALARLLEAERADERAACASVADHFANAHTGLTASAMREIAEEIRDEESAAARAFLRRASK